jgi:ABC-type ATPase involved in cell division
LIVDGPTANGDAEGAFLLVRMLERLNRLGKTVMTATRNVEITHSFDRPSLHLANGASRSPAAAQRDDRAPAKALFARPAVRA